MEPDGIVAACKFFRDQHPDLKPKPTSEAVTEFLARHKGKLSERRHKANSFYLSVFTKTFVGRHLHQITSLEISDIIQHWSQHVTHLLANKRGVHQRVYLVRDEHAQRRSQLGRHLW